jgi:hypothetical protein
VSFSDVIKFRLQGLGEFLNDAGQVISISKFPVTSGSSGQLFENRQILVDLFNHAWATNLDYYLSPVR